VRGILNLQDELCKLANVALDVTKIIGNTDSDIFQVNVEKNLVERRYKIINGVSA